MSADDPGSVESFELVEDSREDITQALGDEHTDDEVLRLKQMVAQLTAQIAAMRVNQGELSAQMYDKNRDIDALKDVDKLKLRDEVAELTTQLETMQIKEKQMIAQLEVKDREIERLRLREDITALKTQMIEVLEVQVNEKQLRQQLEEKDREIQRLRSSSSSALSPNGKMLFGRAKRPVEECPEESASRPPDSTAFTLLQDYNPRLHKTKPSPELLNTMRRMYDTMVNYRTQSGQRLCEPFMELPAEGELPGYYLNIARPISFEMIEEKIESSEYSSVREMEEDVQLLCDNATAYHREDNPNSNTAILIGTVWKAIVGIEEKKGNTSELPDPDPTTKRKEWHGEVETEKRRHVVGKLIKTIFPCPNPPEAIVKYAKKVERELFEKAGDRFEYYRLIVEKIEKIGKELVETKAKRIKE